MVTPSRLPPSIRFWSSVQLVDRPPDRRVSVEHRPAHRSKPPFVDHLADFVRGVLRPDLSSELVEHLDRLAAIAADIRTPRPMRNDINHRLASLYQRDAFAAGDYL